MAQFALLTQAPKPNTRVKGKILVNLETVLTVSRLETDETEILLATGSRLLVTELPREVQAAVVAMGTSAVMEMPPLVHTTAEISLDDVVEAAGLDHQLLEDADEVLAMVQGMAAVAAAALHKTTRTRCPLGCKPQEQLVPDAGEFYAHEEQCALAAIQDLQGIWSGPV